MQLAAATCFCIYLDNNAGGGCNESKEEDSNLRALYTVCPYLLTNMSRHFWLVILGCWVWLSGRAFAQHAQGSASPTQQINKHPEFLYGTVEFGGD